MVKDLTATACVQTVIAKTTVIRENGDQQREDMMQDLTTISQKLAQFFCTLGYEDLSDTLVYQIKAYFLDWLGSAIAGLYQPPTQMMLSLANDMKGSEEATIIPTNSRHLPLVAALVNGAAARKKQVAVAQGRGRRLNPASQLCHQPIPMQLRQRLTAFSNTTGTSPRLILSTKRKTKSSRIQKGA